MTRASVFASVALLGALLAGGAAGYALGRRPGPMKMKEMTMFGLSRTMLLDSLAATPAQRVRIDSVLDIVRVQADSAVSTMMEVVRTASRDARARVRELLDEPQRARFDSLLARAPGMLPRSPVPPP